MKQFMKYSCLIMLACMTAFIAQSKVINIDIDAIKGDLTTQLNSMCEKATYDDTAVLNFGRGKYTIDGTIMLRCNVVIKGQGSDKSTVIIDNNPAKPLTTDTYFMLHGTLANTINVSISDITFRMREHKGIWWKGIEKYIFQIHHANKVDMHNVESYLADANATNFNLHVCSNVTVTDCIFSNYNNSEIGGCLWLRGEMHNVHVWNNKFYKYGKDEALAVFDRLVDNSRKYIRGKANRTNILIEDNDIYYGEYKGNNKKDPESNCGMVFSMLTDHRKSQDQCATRNFSLRNNRFYISEVTSRCIYIGFDPADTHENIRIENNQIINSAIKRDYIFTHHDIDVEDFSSCTDTIAIVNNTVKNSNVVINSEGSSGYTFLHALGATVLVQGNIVTNTATVNPNNGKTAGVRVLSCGTEGGDITMRDNVFKGVNYVGHFNSSKPCKFASFTATNNHFEGDTRIYCHNIEELNLTFTHNTLVSNNMNFFLQEFAKQGKLVFNYNKVTVKPGGGMLMTHWDKKTSTNAMRFNLLEVKGNTFKGVKSERELLQNMTNTRKRKVSSNKVSR